MVTCVASEHHRVLGSLERTRDEKAEMVRALRPGGVAVLNGDDLHVRWMAGVTRARVVTFGLSADNDVRASDVHLDWPRGTRLRVHTREGVRDTEVRLIGRPALGMAGRRVGCALTECHERALPCDACPMLERGWASPHRPGKDKRN